MLRARGQAEQYAKALPEWPPFLIVVDVGHSIETYADFAGLGKHYTQFPDTNSFRVLLHDLTNEELRQRLRTIWLVLQFLGSPSPRGGLGSSESGSRSEAAAKPQGGFRRYRAMAAQDLGYPVRWNSEFESEWHSR